MPFDRALTSLATIEDRFRRLFNLAGSIGASFTPAITPVVLIADTRGPGYSSFKGRKWSWVSDRQVGIISPGLMGFYTPVDVVITSITASFGGGAGCYLYAQLYAPGQALPAAMVGTLTRSCGSWIDQKNSATDATPFLDKQVWLATATGANPELRRFAVWSADASSITVTQPLTMHMPATSTIVFEATITAGGAINGVGLTGEVF